MSSLEIPEILIRRKHPREREVGYVSTDADSWIMRVRHKSSVYAEWKLWPETVRAIEWWLKQREAISVAPTVLYAERNLALAVKVAAETG